MPTFGDLRVKEMYHLLKVQESETGAVVSWDATGESDAVETIGNRMIAHAENRMLARPGGCRVHVGGGA
jgi:hypothetical protein